LKIGHTRATPANQLWDTDSSFKRVPGKISFLSAHELPPAGGETEFADLRAAYDGLEAATREQIENLVAEHSVLHSRSLFGYTDFTEEGAWGGQWTRGERFSGS
jgi:alpha-ketoglutarate-dependent 2,4-dichlorophenoxyacetate dioxygenase